MTNMFDENGNYNKTEWKPGDRITAGKLNKIEESLEAINNNDIERHKEADERLDALEEQNEAVEERVDELEDLVTDNKTEVDTAIYEVHSKMDRLEQEMNEGIEEVHNVAETVDDKIASADASMKAQVNSAKADITTQVNQAKNEMTTQVNTAKNEMTTQVNNAKSEMTSQVNTAKNEMEAMVEEGLTELEEKTFNLSLGIHTDGLIYMFYNGIPQGTGIAMASGEAGDIVGNLDSDNNIILMGSLPNGTYMLKYENIDGTYINVGELEVGRLEPPGPAYTNLAVYNATNNTDFTIWCNDSRLGSDGNKRELAGYVTTNYIELSNSDVIRIEGFVKEETYPILAIYDSDKVLVRTPYYLSNVADNGFITALTQTDTGATFTMFTSNCKYIRLSGKPVDGGENIIITKNEEIV